MSKQRKQIVKPKNLPEGLQYHDAHEIQREWISKAIERRDEIRSGKVKPIPSAEVINEVRRIVGR